MGQYSRLFASLVRNATAEIAGAGANALFGVGGSTASSATRQILRGNSEGAGYTVTRSAVRGAEHSARQEIRETSRQQANPDYIAPARREPRVEANTPIVHRQASVREVEASPSASPVSLDRQETKAMQAGLRMLGIDVGKADGVEGPATRRGIATYLEGHPELAHASRIEILESIRDDMRSNPDAQSRMAEIVAQGKHADPDDGRALQIVLNDTTHADLNVDGVVGKGTARAFNNLMDNQYSVTMDAAPARTYQAAEPAPAATAAGTIQWSNPTPRSNPNCFGLG